jgi:hypothetical protein
LLEVLTRRNIAALIDHREEYIDRAVDLSKHFKLDLAFVRAIQGRTITIGDIVAYNVPVNSFGQIIGYFDTLLGKSVRPLLVGAVDRWAAEIGEKIAGPLRAAGVSELSEELGKMAPGPIIRDFDALAVRLTRLFEIRHVLCHELPAKPLYSVNEIDGFLDEAFRIC